MIKRLEECGIIVDCKAVVDLAALGLGTTAIILLRTTRRSLVKPGHDEVGVRV